MAGRPGQVPSRLRGAVVAGGALVMAATQIAIPLTSRRAGLSSAVVAGLALCAFGLAAGTWGWTRALLAAVLVSPAALGAEVIGIHTGWPFGSYHYTGMLRPTVAGVPVIVPLAWFGMGVAAWAVALRLATRRSSRIVLGAVALTAWDLFLDPQMTRERYWVWDGGGWYRHIPVSNYVGWLVCSAVVMALLSIALPSGRDSVGLIGLYTWMAVMETIGFVVFFSDVVVGAVGGVGMLPLAAVAWRTDPERRPGVGIRR